MSSLGSLFNFENLFSKGITKDVAHNPWRLVTGVDPASTGVWNKVLGHDDKPLTNVWGSPGQQYYDQAKAQGIDTGPAQTFHGIADKVAMHYATQGLFGGASGGGGGGGGLGGFGGGGGGGNTNIVNAMMNMGGQQKPAAVTPPMQITDPNQDSRNQIVQAQLAALPRTY